MTLQSLTCSKLARQALIAVLVTLPAVAAPVKGKVELRDSRDPAVKNRSDFSGVVITLKPTHGTVSAPAGKATIVQKDKT